MTGLSIPPDQRAAIMARLRERAQAWIARLYRHEILVARTVRGMQIEAAAAFEREVVKPIIQLAAGRLSTFDLRGQDIVVEAFPELRALIREVEVAAVRGADAVRRLTTERLAGLVHNEFEWWTELSDRRSRAGIPQEAVDRALQRPWLGDSTERWFQKSLAVPSADNARRVIQTGLQQGWTETDIVRSLRGTPEQPGALDQPRRTVEMVVRTASTAASANGRLEVFREIGVKRWRFVATLDERVSIQCASLDGKTYPVGEGPAPPLHPNCRSVASPVTSRRVGQRASIDGPVPIETSVPDWLMGQPQAVQNRVLGRTRAEAWRAGKLSFERMVGRDAQPLTIGELRRLDRIPDEE